MAETVYLLLGSDLGDRLDYLKEACRRLEQVRGFECVAISPVYVTEPEDMPAGSPSFLNQVVKGEFEYTPAELLTAIEEIEAELGRTDKGQKKPRTIDIDILLFGDRVVTAESLTIPHPKLPSRAFALIPLLEVDPDIVDPASGKPFREYLSKLNTDSVTLYEDHVGRHV
ncbi:MAG: 2-amino-4-hydroxy-6-hydroxymethyldihydropteridine diphosphokinase [Candidatus Zixiibacteriota bacterium]|jgi:2-amino-4-hydroxy-6-hydroxymethyldihydropteridine diphosphokinase